jgi:hypothetical protein
MPTTFIVVNTAVSGAGSLRQAILDANGNAGADTINFNIPASDPNCNATTHVCTIKPTNAFTLPFITDQVTIDGYSQPGAHANTLVNGDDAVLLIELDGSNPDSGPPLVLRGPASGPNIDSSGSLIKGLVIDNGWTFTVVVEAGNISVEGCFIGIDPSGTIARPTTIGVNTGTTFASGMRIGGTTPAARNVMSGNSTAILFQAGSNHVVQGNFFGTDRNGTSAIANGSTAITVQQSDDVMIGGTTAAARNILAGGGGARGIFMGVAARTRIQGNFIGTDVTGTVALGFTGSGCAVCLDSNASNTQVGGLTATPGTPPGNVISGSATGIRIGSPGNNFNNTAAMMGNLIGTDASGTSGLGNSTGIAINDPSNTVGGIDPMARNVISGNTTGISLVSQNNQVQGNFIGTDITGTQLLGNGGDGVLVQANNNTIGGISAGPGQNPGNLIAGNGGRGVNLPFSPNSIPILGNRIYSNGSLGIDLSGDGVTANDHCDGDGGANNLQNFPVITSASIASGMLTISGMLDSGASTSFRLEFFSSVQGDPSGNGEGRTFLGAVNRTTDASCIATFGPLSFPVPAGQSIVTATATRLDDSLNPIEPLNSRRSPT